ncbi:MAG: DUF1667 domain-containing protein [Acutalibacter sp.]|jgi:CxxC motif-containing protein|nr:DUF1667 domain-containing protein [Acutalibacter sp.]
MAVRELICISCPLGCPLRVETDGAGKVTAVTGNTCKRGEAYGRKEVTAPTRTVTSTVLVAGGQSPVVSVRTKGDVPKDSIFAVMAVIRETEVPAPVALGDVLAENIAGTGVDLIATCTVGKREE